MSFLSTLYTKFKVLGATISGKLVWTTDDVMTDTTRSQLRTLLAANNYIILTTHFGHFSTYTIDFAHFIFTFRPGYYGHALLNIEQTISETDEFKFIQATTPGVGYANFDEVFDQQCGSVCLLKPKTLSIEEWSEVIAQAKTDIGKPYDLALDPSQTAALDCVELVRNALQAEPNYATDYAKLEAMVAKHNTLDPQMYYECAQGADAVFDIVFEARVK